MTPKKVVGLVLSVLGFVPELVASAWQEGTTILFFSWPEAALFGAVASFSYGWILVRTAIKDHGVPVMLVNGLGMLGGGCLALVLAFFDRLFNPVTADRFISIIPVTNVEKFIILTAGLIAIGNIACYVLYGYLLKRYTATILTFGELFIPLFAAFYGWLFLREQVHWYFFVSVATILAGMYLFYVEERRLGYVE
jgi:drug/metabolite transporter (DMT)-like permease